MPTNDLDYMENLRLEKVHQALLLDFSDGDEFQNITDLASQLCNKPVAIITFLDQDINWLVVRKGVEAEAMPRATSFCQYCIRQDAILIINDAHKDARFDNNPLVHTDPKVRFYAGAPLVLSDGLKLGALCLLDLRPGDITELQQKALTTLAKQVTNLVELKLSQKLLRQQIDEIQSKNESLKKIAQMQSHYIRQPLTSIMGLVDNVKDGYFKIDGEWLQMMIEATTILDTRIRSIVTESIGSKDIKAQRFHKMVDEVENYAILLLDGEGNIENWNKGAEKIKGYKAHEVIGKHFSIFYTDIDRKNKRPEILLDQAVRNGYAHDEGWRVGKDGVMFWGSIVMTAIHDDRGTVIGFTKVTRDLTEISQANKAKVIPVKQEARKNRKIK